MSPVSKHALNGCACPISKFICIHRVILTFVVFGQSVEGMSCCIAGDAQSRHDDTLWTFVVGICMLIFAFSDGLAIVVLTTQTRRQLIAMVCLETLLLVACIILFGMRMDFTNHVTHYQDQAYNGRPVYLHLIDGNITCVMLLVYGVVRLGTMCLLTRIIELADEVESEKRRIREVGLTGSKSLHAKV